MTARRPKVAVWKFTSCDGCQLSVLDCEDELLTLAGAIDIAHFPEASSASSRGPYDLSLVEGSISTPEEAERIVAVRKASRVLVTIGACASAGGIQALRDFTSVRELAAAVYPRPDVLAVLERSTPIADHVMVDAELRGCPIDRHQLLDAIGTILRGHLPTVTDHSVCVECKLRGEPCVIVTSGLPCLGPVTRDGCGALCPAVGRGCYGCFGPKEHAATDSMGDVLLALGVDDRDVARAFRTFNAGSPAFRRASERHDPRHH